MEKKSILKFFTVILSALTLVCCRNDEWDNYDTVQGWIYHDMMEHYLFYRDVPARNKLNFNLSAEDFLKSAASPKDQKNGYVFSHIERVNTSRSKSVSAQPTYGFESAIMRDRNNRHYFRVLYLQNESPAVEAGLKRGDWIMKVNGEYIGSDGYAKYLAHPTTGCTFTLGSYNGRSFQEIGEITMPAPRYIEEKTLLKDTVLNLDGHRTAYLLYNGFESNDQNDFAEAFSFLYQNPVEHIILDLRYNPGGFISIAQALCSYLAPEDAMGKVLFKMLYSDKTNQVEIHTLKAGLRKIPSALSYQNLYIIAGENTASASELTINCLRPYLGNRLFHVGTETYGKNLAQSNFTDKVAPNIILWLTTCRIANCQGFYDYFDHGLPPDYYVKENLSGPLGAFATEADKLCVPVFRHITDGSFSTKASVFEKEGGPVSEPALIEVDCSIRHKPHTALLDKIDTPL